MGACCEDRCPNAAHAWQMGWSRADQLNRTNLRPGMTYNATLFSQATVVQSSIRVVPNWVSGYAPLFIGFRTRTAGTGAASLSACWQLHAYSWRAGAGRKHALGGQSASRRHAGCQAHCDLPLPAAVLSLLCRACCA